MTEPPQSVPPLPVPSPAPAWQRLIRSPLARIAIFALLLWALATLTAAAGKAMGLSLRAASQAQVTLPLVLVYVLPTVIAYLLLVRLIERRRADELAPGKLLPQVLLGLAAGAALFSAVVALLWLAGSYHVLGTHGDVPWLGAILGLGIAPGINEEIAMRGVLFRITEEGLGTGWALAISSLFFGFGHIFNPHATVWSALAIAIEAGLLFGLLYHLTRSLWVCMGLHAAWNVMQGPVYGISVSGVGGRGWLEARLTGPAWLSGGPFGAEASVVTLLTCLAVSAALYAAIRRRGSLQPPAWRRRLSPQPQGD